MTKAIVIINEVHSLKEEQKKLLQEYFGGYCRYNILKTGLTLNQMEDVAKDLFKLGNVQIVFASPIAPLLLMVLDYSARNNVHVFHNDKRDKKELPNGKVIYTIAEKGWQLY